MVNTGVVAVVIVVLKTEKKEEEKSFKECTVIVGDWCCFVKFFVSETVLRRNVGKLLLTNV